MNILPLMGQAGLHGLDSPVRHEAKHRRLKTVMQCRDFKRPTLG